MQNTKLVIGEKINVRIMHLPLGEKYKKISKVALASD